MLKTNVRHTVIHNLGQTVFLWLFVFETGLICVREGILGIVLPFINIKIGAQCLQDRTRNSDGISSCSAVPARVPSLPPLLFNLVPKRPWGSSKPWLAASSSTVQESMRLRAPGFYLVMYPQRRSCPLGQAAPIQLATWQNPHSV